MKKLEKRLETEALTEFISLVDTEGSLGAKVRRVMREELTDRQRELMYLYYEEQMNMSEIARLLGLTPSTVSRTLNRGRGRIRKYLQYNGRSMASSLFD